MDRRRRRYSLEFLKAFDAAARALSFTRAAQELYVTQSAISRAIRKLEQQCGRSLFHRVDRGLVLTDAGQDLHTAVKAAFSSIDDSMNRLRGKQVQEQLTVTINVAAGSLWLAPRLARFWQKRAGADVRIFATDKLLNLEREGVDVAIRHFPPESKAQDFVPLMVERVFPVCSPKLARNRMRPLVSPKDLEHHALLQFETYTSIGPWLDWTRWLKARGLTELAPAGRVRFSHYDQAIRAAVDGTGVALGRYPLVADHMRAGRLVALFQDPGVVSGVYSVMTTSGVAERPITKTFLAWLRDEAQRDTKFPAADR